MTTEKIDNPENFLNSFSFHDVTLDGVNIHFDRQTAEMVMPDMNWNYEGSEGYVKRPCRLVFGSVTEYFININDFEGVRIGNIKSDTKGESISATITLNLGGGVFRSNFDHIRFVFKSLEVVDM